MAISGGEGTLPKFVALMAVVLVCALLSFLVPKIQATLLFGVLGALIIFGTCFISPQTGIFFLVISMLLSPEFGGGGAPVAGEGGQDAARGGAVVRIDDLLLVIIGLGWFARGAIHKELGLFRRTELNRPIAVYMMVCILSTLMGMAWGNVRPMLGTFFVIRYFEYFIVLYMVLNYVEDLTQVKRYIALAFVVCLITSAVAILQIPTGKRVSAPFEGEFGEPNTLGGYLVFFMAVSLGFALHAKKLKTILRHAAFVVYITIPLLFSLSRASWLAAVPMWLILTFMSRRTRSMLAITVVLIVIGPAIAPSSVQERALFIFTQKVQKGQVKLGAVKVDTSTSARLESWGLGIAQWKTAPIFGHGVTGTSFMDAQYFRVLAETGLLGMGAFLWLLYTVHRIGMRAWRVGKDDEWLGGLAMGYYAGFAALLVHAIGSNTFIILRIMEPFWLFTGLLIVSTEIKERELARVSPRPSGKPAAVEGVSAPVPAGDGKPRRPSLRSPGTGLRPKAIP